MRRRRTSRLAYHFIAAGGRSVTHFPPEFPGLWVVGTNGDLKAVLRGPGREQGTAPVPSALGGDLILAAAVWSSW